MCEPRPRILPDVAAKSADRVPITEPKYAIVPIKPRATTEMTAYVAILTLYPVLLHQPGELRTYITHIRAAQIRFVLLSRISILEA